jgi:5-methylcytosine-specific restriction protein B
MRQADRILQHVVAAHFVPAWKEGTPAIELRAGVLHEALGLISRVPAVCSVLGSERLQKLTGTQLVERRGPQQGANAVFVYNLR